MCVPVFGTSTFGIFFLLNRVILFINDESQFWESFGWARKNPYVQVWAFDPFPPLPIAVMPSSVYRTFLVKEFEKTLVLLLYNFILILLSTIYCWRETRFSLHIKFSV